MSVDPGHSNDASSAPHRRGPRRTLRILAWLGLGLLFTVVAFRLLAGPYVSRSLQDEIARCRAAGQPVYPGDFDTAPVPDTQNVVIVYRQAWESLKGLSTEQAESARRLLEQPRAIADKPDWVAGLVKAGAKARTLVRESRSCSAVDWGYHIRSVVVDANDPDLAEVLKLARVLEMFALDAHQTGDDAEAVETFMDLMRLAHHVDRRPSIISHMVSIAIMGMTCRCMEPVIPGLETGSNGPFTGPTGRPAPRSRVQMLIAELLDQAALREDMVRAFLGERAMLLDTSMRLYGVPSGPASGKGTQAVPTSLPAQPRPWTPGLGLILEADVLWMMRYSTALAEAVRQATLPGFKKHAPPTPPSDSRWFFSLHPLSSIMLPSFDRALQLHFRCIAERRMAATSLAIRTYQQDYGRRPASLEDLVPAYLPAVPDDPFSATGGKLGYRPEGNPPVLYSVNLDGLDEGGAFSIRSSGGVDSDARDLPFFLNGDRPYSKSTTTASRATTAPDARE
jgi:hypothetical protein